MKVDPDTLALLTTDSATDGFQLAATRSPLG
jgi:hypothetical protein